MPLTSVSSGWKSILGAARDIVGGSVVRDTVGRSVVRDTVGGSVVRDTVGGSVVRDTVGGSVVRDTVGGSVTRVSVEATTTAVQAWVVAQSDDWAFIADNAEFLLTGVVVTVALTITSLTLGFLAGFPAGAIEAYGSGRLRSAVRGAGVILRGTPIVVLIVLVFFGVPIPQLGSVPVVDVNLDAFLAATLALGFRSAAYQSQVFRGAIDSIGSGQMEAARSVGMSEITAIRHVIFPQAVRRALPGFQNEFTIVLKDTSVAFAIGLAELLTRADQLYLQPGRSTAVTEVILVISAIYFLLTFATNRSLDALAERTAIPGGDE